MMFGVARSPTCDIVVQGEGIKKRTQTILHAVMKNKDPDHYEQQTDLEAFRPAH